MGTTDDTSKKRPARNTPARNSATPNVSPETSRTATTLLEQAIESERRRLLHVHGVLHCLYEVLLYADDEDAVVPLVAEKVRAFWADGGGGSDREKEGSRYQRLQVLRTCHGVCFLRIFCFFLR